MFEAALWAALRPLVAARAHTQCRAERGITTLEYAVGGGVIITIVAVGVTAFGTALDALFDRLATDLAAIAP